MKFSRKTQKLTATAMFTAIVFVITITVRFPIPAMEGYLNIGDAVIFVAGAILGPVPALIAGGIGSALADLAGFPAWAIHTLFIKGAEGFVCGLVFLANVSRETFVPQLGDKAVKLGGGRSVTAPTHDNGQAHENHPIVGAVTDRPHKIKRIFICALALLSASAVMILGYNVAAAVMFGGWEAALATSVVPNIVQCAVSAGIAVPVIAVLEKFLSQRR